MIEILKSICDKHNYKIAYNTKKITLEDILLSASNGNNMIKDITTKFNCSKATVTRVLKLTFPDRDTKKSLSIRNFLLEKENLKLCTKCTQVLELNTNNFYNNLSNKTGFSDICKECSKLMRVSSYLKNPQKEIADNRNRQLENINRIPKWADLAAIDEFYRNRPQGYHVDHIIPLRGENVCGLHVLENLQYLPAAENLAKGNRLPKNIS
jgi:hypothetical protein